MSRIGPRPEDEVIKIDKQLRLDEFILILQEIQKSHGNINVVPKLGPDRFQWKNEGLESITVKHYNGFYSTLVEIK